MSGNERRCATSIWAKWVVASVASHATAYAVFLVAYGLGGWRMESESVLLATLVAMGASVGVIQWTVLRECVGQAGWWVLASTIGWAAIGCTAIGHYVLAAVVEVALQCLILRRIGRKAIWWTFSGFANGVIRLGAFYVLAYGVAMGTSEIVEVTVLSAIGLGAYSVILGAIGGALTGAPTGAVLRWLFHEAAERQQA